jgi:hypothetical protein
MPTVSMVGSAPSGAESQRKADEFPLVGLRVF